MLQTVHDGEKNFNCNSCDKIFAQSGDLKGHIQTIHEETRKTI